VQSVVVTARKLEVETLIDRKVYSIEADVQSAFGTVSDVLTAIPSIDVDTDGVISLRGDSNVLILVDGKPSPLFSGPNAGENLQSIPAKDIERIEVITNPPAQFKADGTAGVINIVTRRQREDGTAGSVQLSLGSSGRSLVGGNVAHKAGALSLGLNATYRQDYKARSSHSDLVSLDPASGLPVDHASTIHERVRRSSPPVALTASYTFNDRQTLTASLSRTGRAGHRAYTEENDARAADGSLLGSALRLSDGHDREVNVDSELGFTQTFARPGETLDLSLHHSGSTESEHYDYTNVPVLPAAPTYYNNLGFHDEHGVLEAGLDYVRPLPRGRTLKAGGSFEQDDFLYRSAGYDVDLGSGTQVENPLLHDDFSYWRQIASLYATLQATHGAWSWLGGLRTEYARTEGRQLMQDVATATHALEVFPSLHVERSLSDRSTLSVSASRRVSRPEPDALDPFVDREYTPNLRAGNADLKPQYTRSFEVGYAYEGGAWTASVTGYYRQNRDSATEVTRDLGGGFTLQTRTNLPRNDSAGLEFTATGHLLPRLAYSASGNAFYSEIDATALGTPGLRTTAGLNGKLKLDWRATATDSAQLTINRNDRRLTPQGSVGAVTVVNLGMRHQLRPTLTAVATLSDVFSSQRFERWSTTPTFSSHALRTWQGRVLWFGLVQAFGSSKKDKPPSFEYDP
jgi:outer membrane receptor protein involved in Fe transport